MRLNIQAFFIAIAATLTLSVSTANAAIRITSGPAVSNLSETSATISWTLSRFGTGQVKYGLTAGVLDKASIPEDSFNYKSHSQNLSALLPGTVYYYQVVSKDSTGSTVISPTKSFKTLGVGFSITSGPTVSEITETSVKITWSLNEFGTGQIKYGTTSSYGSLWTPENSFNYSTHVQTIRELQPGTLYHFQVFSRNASGVTVYSADQTFTTTAPPPEYTYSWSAGAYGSCSATACGTTGTQTRSVVCRRSDGAIVDDAFCSLPKPVTSISCSAPACPFSWTTGFDTTPEPSMSVPELNIPYTEPSYGLTVTRVTDRTMVTDTALPSMLRHEYSRRPAFNLDTTKALMQGGGSLRLLAVDKTGNKMSFIKTLPVSASAEPNWSPTDPNVFYYFSGRKIMSYNISTDVSTIARDLAAKIPFGSTDSVITTGGEGRPSDNGRIWCLMVKSSSAHYGLIAYDFAADQVLGSFATSASPNNISTSSKGNYCVPAWDSANGGLRTYNLTFTSYRQLHTKSTHSDVALTDAGAEALVFADYTSGYVVLADLATGLKTNLFAIYQNGASSSMHISGVGTGKPGYAVVSLFNCTESGAECSPTQWYKNKVVLVQLKANPTIYNLAHTHSNYAEIVPINSSTAYWSQPHAVPSRDLSKILFVTTWGGVNSSDISDYMIDIPVSNLP